jgi:nucleoside permease NupC
MGAYISFGIDPSHLLSASVMSAPAALAFAKLMYPETKVSKTTSKQIYENKPKRYGESFLMMTTKLKLNTFNM